MKKELKHLHTFEQHTDKNLNISGVINSIDEFRDFIDSYSNEILLNVQGESDGWNQKITAINKILNDNNIEVSDDIWNNDELEEIINSI
jgi:hypothetical protein